MEGTIMSRIGFVLAVSMVNLFAMAAVGHAAPTGHPAAACDPTLPPVLGGCRAASPYTAEIQDGAGGLGPNFSSSRPVLYGWIQILNTGPAMPHLVIRMDTRGTWTVRHVFAELNTGSRTLRRWRKWLGPRVSPFLWDFGRFPAGSVMTIRFRMRLSNGCSFAMEFQSFGNVNQQGKPNLNAVVWNGQGGEGGGIGSCTSGP
jgi:hypothetical protein